MYLKLQLGKLDFSLGQPLTKAPKKPMVMQVSHPILSGDVVEQEFIIDDESNLRYQN